MVSALVPFFLICTCCDASILVTVFNSCPFRFLFYQLCSDASISVNLQDLPFLLSVLLVVINNGIGNQGEVSWL